MKKDSGRGRGHTPRTAELLLAEGCMILDALRDGGTQLDSELAKHCAPERRRMLRHLLFTFFRRRKMLCRLIAENVNREPESRVQSLLEAAAVQIFFQSGIRPESVVNVAVGYARRFHAHGFVNAVLRKLCRIHEGAGNVPETPADILPDFILERWEKDFSAATAADLAGIFIKEPPFTCRMEYEWQPDFPAEPVAASGSYRFFRVEKAADVLSSDSLKYGRCYIQDPATALAPSLAAADLAGASSVLDLCAAPGGKTLMLIEKAPVHCRFTVADPSALRQEMTAENLRLRGLEKRCRLLNAFPRQIDGEYDVVLADVPCSNSGVFRHRPDALWRLSEAVISEAAEQQREILESAARLTRSGGVLIYSTCSIDRRENQDQMAGFIARHPEFMLEEEQLLMPGIEHDGAFAARLRKK